MSFFTWRKEEPRWLLYLLVRTRKRPTAIAGTATNRGIIPIQTGFMPVTHSVSSADTVNTATQNTHMFLLTHRGRVGHRAGSTTSLVIRGSAHQNRMTAICIREL